MNFKKTLVLGLLITAITPCYGEMDSKTKKEKQLAKVHNQHSLDNEILNIFQNSKYPSNLKNLLKKILKLVKNGANPNQILQEKYSYPTTPLAIAVETGNLGAVKTLLEHGANPNFFERLSPLFHVQKNINIAKILLEYGADPYLPVGDGSGMTPLHFAVIWDHYKYELIKLYLECDSPNKNIDIKCNKGETPLLRLENTYYRRHMTSEEYTKRKNLLLKYGANPNAKVSKKILIRREKDEIHYKKLSGIILGAAGVILCFAYLTQL